MHPWNGWHYFRARVEVRSIAPDSASLIGSLAGKIRVHGDLLSTGLRWDAES